MNREILQKFRRSPHLLGHYLGYSKLLPIHSEWILYCWTGLEATKVLQAHRNSYKTTAVDVVGVIWNLLFHPNDRILILRKEHDGATSTLKEIRSHYEKPKLLSLYSLVYETTINSLMGNNWRDDSFTLLTKTTATREGNVEALGSRGAITGRHYEVLLADDVIGPEDKAHKKERERVKGVIRESRNIPVPEGRRIFTGTPWHREDGFSILPHARRYPVMITDDDPAANVPGIPGFTPEFITELRGDMTTAQFAANYLLRFVNDEGGDFGEPKYAAWPEGCQPRGWVDPAYSGDNTTAFVMIAQYDGLVYMRGWAWRKDITNCASEVAALWEKYHCGTCYVETNADQGSNVRGALGDLTRLGVVCVGRRESQNKHVKIIQFLKPAWNKILLAEDCQPEFINQIMDYREGDEPDDAPDAAASLVRELRLFIGQSFKDRFAIR